MILNDRLKRNLKAGSRQTGVFINIQAPALVEMAGMAGFDFAILDSEHGPLNHMGMEELVRAGSAVGLPVMVRVQTNSPVAILRALDLGAAGVQVPQINSAAQAAAAVKAAKYPPVGERGAAGSHRAAGYGLFGNAQYYAEANEKTLVALHIETVEAVENLADMLQVQGVDVWFIGPNDLAASMGYPGQAGLPVVQERIAHCIEMVRKAGVAVGILSPSPADVHKWSASGVQYHLTTSVGLFGAALKGYINGCNQPS